MVRIKKILLLALLIILTLTMLCACMPDMTKEVDIVLQDDDGQDIILGKYRVVSKYGMSEDSYDVRAGELNGLLDIFKSSQYYAGESILQESLYRTQYTHINLNKNTVWLADEGKIWVCQVDGTKRVVTDYVSSVSIVDYDKEVYLNLSCVLFMRQDSQPVFDKHYKTQFSWGQIKKFYSQTKVNETEKSITVNCHYRENQNIYDGTTKIFYNEKDMTFYVSSDFKSN